MNFLKIGVVLAALISQPVVHAEEASAEKIKILLELTGSATIGVQVLQQLYPALKQMDPEIPEEFLKEYLGDVNPQELTDQLVVIYRKYLDADDVDGAIAFYRTKAGRKFIEAFPLLFQESTQAGNKWGRGIARGAIEEYRSTRPAKKE